MSIKKAYKSLETNFKNTKVLFVESCDDQWIIIQQALQKCIPELIPVRASTTQQAADLLEQWSCLEWEIPRLIFLDIQLPQRIDGLQLLRQIKTMTDSVSQIPILMLSSMSDETNILEAYKLGVSAYILKPTELSGWPSFFKGIRSYWLETGKLPPVRY